MSAPKSNMPNGTRQAALVAFCLAACLLAWRGTTLLTNHDTRAVPQASLEMQELQSLIEPVLGREAMRLASHTDQEGARSILILVNAAGDQFHLGAEKTDRIEMILTAATGFDPTRDTLQIQPFAFAPGTTGKVTTIELAEIAGLFIVTGLLGLIAFRRSSAPAMEPYNREPFAMPEKPSEGAGPHLRAVPLEPEPAGTGQDGDAQRLARENPKQTASIIRNWLNDGGAS